MSAGHYIALEGLEGAGKSTVARLVAEWLRSMGHEVLLVREPGGTEVGEAVRAVLLDPGGEVSPRSEALLFAAARAELAHEVIRPALSNGSWVVSDRCVYSSLAYQGVGRKLGLAAVRTINEFGLEELWPELVVLLRVDARLGLERQRIADRFDREDDDYWSRVVVGYDELAATEPERFVVVPADRILEQVTSDVTAAISERWA